MNNIAWIAYLNTLPPDHREMAQNLMERVQTVLNADRQGTFNEIQRGHRRSDRNAERINELAIRLDVYEEQRAADVRAELEQFAREQLSKEESDQLIAILYQLAVRVERLEGSDDQQSKEA